MENDVSKRLDAIETKIEAVYQSAEKTRKYFLWTMIVTIAMFVVPLIALIVVVPFFLSSYLGAMEGLL